MRNERLYTANFKAFLLDKKLDFLA